MKSTKSSRADLQQVAAGTSAKKAYATPRLIEYGSVAKLTATGAGSTSDGTMSMKVCL